MHSSRYGTGCTSCLHIPRHSFTLLPPSAELFAPCHSGPSLVAPTTAYALMLHPPHLDYDFNSRLLRTAPGQRCRCHRGLVHWNDVWPLEGLAKTNGDSLCSDCLTSKRQPRLLLGSRQYDPNSVFACCSPIYRGLPTSSCGTCISVARKSIDRHRVPRSKSQS